ncbi:isochorismatase family cysteine hydrolase [Romboutsia lituseburensis]|uniref:Nicotinamidase-related amidase n=1 Tax=Romboutsia lituseburensis DSM 797 TaxID=1121325 RepID=A0A1G9L7X8_9FIRM|nr:isochorismatase family cysteine hydrolase [Romboutsia lituseburensis]CEH35199.1 Isochorismatase protein [Romboutsia lituseburensis]SDL57843.1 Nicotinamidase-related amidase [Romboutsia lituseburensis DSM 797]
MEHLLNDLKILKDNLENLPVENLDDINLSKTELFIVDINNGFAKSGALYSPRVEALINPITNFTKYISGKVKNIIAFTDCHDENSLELSNYPSHCLISDFESEIVDELKEIGNIKILPKNSTNGFFVLDDIKFESTENIIIVGDCTDICIYQLAITLKSYFNQHNMNKNIIIPVNLVDTYDIPNIHSAELLNIVFFNSLMQNGIKVVKNIKY